MKGSIIDWLLQGNIAIQFQTRRDLLGEEDVKLQHKISKVGWGKQFLLARNEKGEWGQRYYQPKWISTHYTLLDLKNLAIHPDTQEIQHVVRRIWKEEKGADGGILPIGSVQKSDVCVNGMALNVAAYFGQNEKDMESVIDFLLREVMPNGGFNCMSNRSGAVHSSMHSSISVLEGLQEYLKNGYTYRLKEIKMAKQSSIEFLLMHRLFRSDKSGEIIHPNFLKLYYPCRWYYDILRALDFFQSANVTFDARINDALNILMSKRTKEGRWKLAAFHPGQQHIIMEKPGLPSRWNTLRVARVLKCYLPSAYH